MSDVRVPRRVRKFAIVNPGVFAVAATLASALPAAAETGNYLKCMVHPSPDEGRLATCSGRVSKDYATWAFVLRGRPPNIVTRIEIYQEGVEAPRQVLEGFELRPPLVRGDARSPGRVAFVLQDVNFDKLSDLRIAIGPADGEGVSYRWFLFDKESDRFVATDLLDVLKSPIINPRRRTLLGAFKDDNGRAGRMAFKWRDGKIEPVSAIAYERKDDGTCIASHYRLVDGKFQKIRETECRDAEKERDDAATGEE